MLFCSQADENRSNVLHAVVDILSRKPDIAKLLIAGAMFALSALILTRFLFAENLDGDAKGESEGKSSDGESKEVKSDKSKDSKAKETDKAADKEKAKEKDPFDGLTKVKLSLS